MEAQGLNVESEPSHDDMQVDDTSHRVYIGDLDAEIADIEAHEPRERLIFLPDIEKHFSRIPLGVLLAGEDSKPDDSPEEQQLVLYDVPKSLTVAEGHDSVRKAIIEARRRAQDKAAAEARQERVKQEQVGIGDVPPKRYGQEHGDGASEADSDAMDIG